MLQHRYQISLPTENVRKSSPIRAYGKPIVRVRKLLRRENHVFIVRTTCAHVRKFSWWKIGADLGHRHSTGKFLILMRWEHEKGSGALQRGNDGNHQTGKREGRDLRPVLCRSRR